MNIHHKKRKCEEIEPLNQIVQKIAVLNNVPINESNEAEEIITVPISITEEVSIDDCLTESQVEILETSEIGASDAQELEEIVIQTALNHEDVEVTGSEESSQAIKNIEDSENSNTPNEVVQLHKSDDGKFHCHLCSAAYTRAHRLQIHLQMKHQVGKEKTVSVNKLNQKCYFPGCDQSFYKKIQLSAHLEKEHSQKLDEKILYFDNSDSFFAWKVQEEQENYVYFTKHFGQCRNRTYYYCQQDGKVYTHKRKDQPFRITSRRNKRGSVKTGCICPAKMVVIKNIKNDKIQVNYTSTHSHPVSIENTIHHPLPDSAKSHIIAKLSFGVSVDDIYNDFESRRSHMLAGSSFNCTITKSTIQDLKSKLNRYQKMNPDDTQSIVVLQQEMLRNEASIYDMEEEKRFHDNIDKLKKVLEEPVLKRLCLSDVNKTLEQLVKDVESMKQRDINEMGEEELVQFFDRLRYKSIK